MAKMYMDLNVMRDNAQRLSQIRPLIAVVKADAYGINMQKTASALLDIVDVFAVWTQKEASELAEMCPNKDILMLGRPCEKALYRNIVISVFSEVDYKYAHTMVAVNVDTGMHRMGVRPAVLGYLCDTASRKSLQLHSVYSHLFAPLNEDISRKQIEVFDSCTEGIDCKRHLSASAGALQLYVRHYDYLRCGMAIYENSVEVFAKILLIRNVKKGEYVGYGEVPLAANTTIAIIDIGYRDGYRQLTNNRYVWINGTKCKVVNVCMDVSIVDISYCNACVCDIVEILSKNIPEKELALSYGTSTYECFTFLDRVEKHYLNE